MAWPSSVKVAKSGSASSTSSTSSTTEASLSWKASNGRYHSRSQWVCGTTWKRRAASLSLLGAAHRGIEPVAPDQVSERADQWPHGGDAHASLGSDRLDAHFGVDLGVAGR